MMGPLLVAMSLAYVDRDGALRWRDTGEEVALFGVNYYAPFTWDYRLLRQLGVDVKRAIERDVAHFAKMGLTAVRLHVFDREISDRRGNLLENDHLLMLDWLIYQCKRRGIYVVLTPIAWWPAGGKTSGFSDFFTKPQLVVDPRAREAQARYLEQFVSHVNPFTRMAYKDDPAIVAFELINEPAYPPGAPDEVVVDYINTLARAIRKTGCRKPLFYNGWFGRHKAVAEAEVDGCSFGWYPTGLVAGRSRWQNFLPKVDDYPSMRDPVLAHKAKIVYEFDAADVPGSYMYPAMARAFRSGGAQIATQFQYDPLDIARWNTNWMTHYLNLVCTPSKAVSFIIAGEAFRSLPRLKLWGRYPKSARFGPFRVSYEEDLSEMATERAFMHSNDTKTMPPAPEKLERVVGCGSSPVVKYGGTGAYFLDKLAPGLWRLEVLPDAVWVNDPHGPPSLKREVCRIIWARHRMTIRLPDLGGDFSVERVDGLKEFRARAQGGSFEVEPGIYVLRARGCRAPLPPGLDTEFVALPPSGGPPAAWVVAPSVAVEGMPLTIRATAAGPDGEPDEVSLLIRQEGGEQLTLPMRRVEPYRFEATISGDLLRRGRARVSVLVRSGREARLFPGGVKAEGPQVKSLPLYEPGRGTFEVEFHRPDGNKGGAEIVKVEGRSVLRLWATGFAEEPSCLAVRLKVRLPEGISLRRYKTLCVRARALKPWTTKFELGLVERDGDAYGWVVPLSTAWRDLKVSLDSLHPLWGTVGEGPDLRELSELSLVFGAWLFKHERGRPHAFEIASVWLEGPEAGMEVVVLRRSEPLPLLSPDLGGPFSRPKVGGDVPVDVSVVESPWGRAFRLHVRGFRKPPSCVSARAEVGDEFALLGREVLRGMRSLVVRARGGEPATNALEVVLIEEDGAPWGTVVPLSTEWRQIVVPLTKLRFFRHWPHPRGRGGPGDRVRPERVVAVNLCFGAWLYPGHEAEPHTVEIATVGLSW